MTDIHQFREQVLQRLTRLETKIDTLKWVVAGVSSLVGAVVAAIVGAMI